jgi:hypothetical protein
MGTGRFTLQPGKKDVGKEIPRPNPQRVQPVWAKLQVQTWSPAPTQEEHGVNENIGKGHKQQHIFCTCCMLEGEPDAWNMYSVNLCFLLNSTF